MSQTYYFVAASQSFIESEPLNEVLAERTRNYAEKNKPIDFFYVERPAFLDAPELAELSAKVDRPAVAVISTDPKMIRWLRLRLEFVEMGEFQAENQEKATRSLV
ncbi:MAG: MgPME-cyclase complex family protein [Cyanobacteria bacterium J06642_2]